MTVSATQAISFYCKKCDSTEGILVRCKNKNGSETDRFRCIKCQGFMSAKDPSAFKITLPCGVCGKPVTRSRSFMRYYQATNLFCNRKCFGISIREHPEHRKKKSKTAAWWRDRWQRQRRMAMLKVSPNLQCSKCGCENIRILEINHKNGGGNKEFKQFYDNDVRKFWRAIISGQRKTDDLDLRCKVCNIVHYVELLGISGFKVIYTK